MIFLTFLWDMVAASGVLFMCCGCWCKLSWTKQIVFKKTTTTKQNPCFRADNLCVWPWRSELQLDLRMFNQSWGYLALKGAGGCLSERCSGERSSFQRWALDVTRVEQASGWCWNNVRNLLEDAWVTHQYGFYLNSSAAVWLFTDLSSSTSFLFSSI